MTKIVTMAALKGGVGKTTMTYNFAEWLAKNGNRVLLIDLDFQCNLTHTYDIYKTEGTVANIFTRQDEAKIIDIPDKSISLIAGDLNLGEVKEYLATKNDKATRMRLWIRQNIQRLADYDYILIDCHPDADEITQNAFLCSDIIISPIAPDQFSVDSRVQLKGQYRKIQDDTLNPDTGESYLQAPVLFFVNKINLSEEASKEILKVIPKLDDVLEAYVPKRTLFNKSTLEKISLAEMSTRGGYSKYKDLFKTMDHFFSLLKEKVDEQ